MSDFDFPLIPPEPPEPPPEPPSGGYFTRMILRNVPPWLRRTNGARLLQGIADELDATMDRTADAVQLRFPRASQTDALAVIGRERRIRRGVLESAATYASRLLTWWDAHRGRGGPYALLEQLRAFWAGSYVTAIELIDYNGSRFSLDFASGEITRDAIGWGGDGSGKWARQWLLVYTDESIDPSAFTASEIENWKSIPREWTAAHVQKTTIYFMDGVELWGTPGRTWTASRTWGSGPLTSIIIEAT